MIRLFAFILVLSSSTLADEYLLTKRVNLEFQPVSAYFLIYADSNFEVRSAELATEGVSGEYVLILPLELNPDLTSLRSAVLVLGTGSDSSFIAAEEYKIHRDLLGAGVEKLQTLVSDDLSIKEQIQEKFATKEAELTQLRLLVGEKSSLNQVVSMEQEVDRLLKEKESLRNDISILQEAILVAKDLPQPRKYTRREVDLGKQLSEIARVTGDVEDNESRLARLKQYELEKGVSAVEEAKFYDLEELEREYARLQQIKRDRDAGLPTDENQTDQISSDYLSIENR